MTKLVNNFTNNKICIYVANILSYLSPSRINKSLIITSLYIVILKMYKILY